MDESNFDRLLERYVTGQVTAQEKRKIEAWLEVRKTKGEENTSLTDDEEEALFSKIIANIDNEKEIRSIRPEIVRKSRRMMTLAIAASMALLISVGIIISIDPFENSDDTASSERIILKDGSIVWLRGSSTFHYSESSEGNRHGVLNGEALFEIAKDPLHPFDITYKGFTITVVGTSFNVRATNDSLELKVLTGRVRVTTTTDSTGVVVERLQTITMGGSQIKKSSFDDQAIASIVNGTQYDMNFSNIDMRSVAERLSAKFNVEFEFSNERIGKCRVTADFTDRSLESTTEMLADALNARFVKDGATIRIEGSGCE